MAEVEVEKLSYNGGSRNGIVVVNPKPCKGLTSKLIDWFEKLVVKLMYDSPQPLKYLSGNFRPVRHETPPTKDLPVIGYLPVSYSFTCIYLFLIISVYMAETFVIN